MKGSGINGARKLRISKQFNKTQFKLCTVSGKQCSGQYSKIKQQILNSKQEFLEFSYVSWYDNLLKKYVEVEKF